MKVTEEVRTTVEARLKESSEYQAQLEKKLMESEKEKQELQEEKRKAVENMEQQVCTLPESPQEWAFTKLPQLVISKGNKMTVTRITAGPTLKVKNYIFTGKDLCILISQNIESICLF